MAGASSETSIWSSSIWVEYDEAWPLSHFVIPLLVTVYLHALVVSFSFAIVEKRTNALHCITFAAVLMAVLAWEGLEQLVLAPQWDYFDEDVLDSLVGDVLMGVCGFAAARMLMVGEQSLLPANKIGKQLLSHALLFALIQTLLWQLSFPFKELVALFVAFLASSELLTQYGWATPDLRIVRYFGMCFPLLLSIFLVSGCLRGCTEATSPPQLFQGKFTLIFVGVVGLVVARFIRGHFADSTKTFVPSHGLYMYNALSRRNNGMV
jgi:hypothetical protein